MIVANGFVAVPSIPGVDTSIWDFRNESARAYLADQVAGYFARNPASDDVFFDGVSSGVVVYKILYVCSLT